MVTQSDFAKDVVKGLTSNPKYLDSKYFYDERGSKIFQDIMRMPEYYLTDCELENLKTQKREIFESFDTFDKPFEIIELGAGDGLKTKVLLEYFYNHDQPFTYIPIDISRNALLKLQSDINEEFPELKVKGLIGDYFKVIKELSSENSRKKVLLFLGSNIGNLEVQESIAFLQNLKNVMLAGDLLFIGFDLKKDPEIIFKAYNDPHGHTEAFNLNLLHRINNELDANFIPDNFSHKQIYNEKTGAARSYLISEKEQDVELGKTGHVFQFEDQEDIFTEVSQKYDMEMIAKLARGSGFEIIRNFFDPKKYFVNSLWKLKD
jgi:dimethylhistidine N-methyltransferase